MYAIMSLPDPYENGEVSLLLYDENDDLIDVLFFASTKAAEEAMERYGWQHYTFED